MLLNAPISPLPFKQWLLNDNENKLLLKVAVGLILISFTLLKVLYPYPNFMSPDSNSYLDAAYKNEFINFWAIGYSKFLRLLSCFSNSDLMLVFIQYILLQGSLLYFVFSIKYFFSPNLYILRVILITSITNPLIPLISNFVSSDSLFTILSLIWFTQLLWILYKPNRNLLIIHSIILLIAFSLRYNALYYPILSILIITIARLTNRAKFFGIGVILFLLGFFIIRTEHEYYLKTGTTQFSAFSGWQIASNALYGYAYAEPQNILELPNRFRSLHLIVNRHMDSLRLLKNRPDNEVAIYYLWDFKSPLKVYLMEKWRNDSTTIFFSKWAKMAPLYSQYGYYIISKHPWPFLKHYIWPNLIKFYAPPTKFMGVYNSGHEKVDDIVVNWFGWKNNKVFTNIVNEKIQVTEVFRILMPMINLIFICCSLSFIFFGSYKYCNWHCVRIIWCALIVWVINLIFSVLAAPIELRYQLFPMIISITFDVLFISYYFEHIREFESRTIKNKNLRSEINAV